jgi:hypothetical protein
MLLLILSWCHILALLVVDVAAQFKVDIALGGGGRGSAVGGRKSLASGNGWVWAGLEGLQASWGIGDNAEVASEWGADIGGAGLGVDLSRLVLFQSVKNTVSGLTW